MADLRSEYEAYANGLRGAGLPVPSFEQYAARRGGGVNNQSVVPGRPMTPAPPVPPSRYQLDPSKRAPSPPQDYRLPQSDVRWQGEDNPASWRLDPSGIDAPSRRPTPFRNAGDARPVLSEMGGPEGDPATAGDAASDMLDAAKSERSELERLRKIKRLKELEAKEAASSAPQQESKSTTRAEVIPLMARHGATFALDDEAAGLRAAATSGLPESMRKPADMLMQAVGPGPMINDMMQGAGGVGFEIGKQIAGTGDAQPGAYEQGRNAVREQQAAARSEYPATSLLSEIAGIDFV